MIKIQKSISIYITDQDEYEIVNLKIKILGITIWQTNHEFDINDLTSEETPIGYKN